MVETVHQCIPGLPHLQLAASLLRHRMRLPLQLGRVISPLSSLSSLTLMDEGALLLGLALADGRTVLPPVEPVSHGGEDRDG